MMKFNASDNSVVAHPLDSRVGFLLCVVKMLHCRPDSLSGSGTNCTHGTLPRSALLRRIGADRHLVAVGQIDLRVENDLVAFSHARAHFDRGAKIPYRGDL